MHIIDMDAQNFCFTYNQRSPNKEQTASAIKLAFQHAYIDMDAQHFCFTWNQRSPNKKQTASAIAYPFGLWHSINSNNPHSWETGNTYHINKSHVTALIQVLGFKME